MPLPDEGIKIAALPAASSPDAIDLVGVQAGVTKKLASTLLATQAELDAVNAAAAHLAGAETFTGAKTFTAQSTPFGVGAAGAAGCAVAVFGDAGEGNLSVIGTPANINLILRSKGSGSIRLQSGTGADLVVIGSTGQVSATGQGHTFGIGALGAAGTYLQIDGDATNVYLRAFGTPANVPVLVASKGASSVHLQTQGGIDQLIVDNGPAASSTVMRLGVSNNSGASMQRVSLGAVDSAGAGFRALRVPN